MTDKAQPFTTAEIRNLLATAFDDVGLIALCLDEFPELCNKLGSGMRKDQIINVIMDHFRRCGDCAPLLAAVREREPEIYDTWEASLLVELKTEVRGAPPPVGCKARIGSWVLVLQELPAAVQVTVVVVLLAIAGLCVVAGRPVVRQWVASGSDRPTPTARAVHLTDAHIRFTVTLSNGSKLEVPTGGVLSLSPDDRVLIEVNVTVDHWLFPRDLTYQYFALEGSIPQELTGPTASYSAPEKPGADIIAVRIRDQETRDEIVRSINVEVKEQLP